MKILKIGGILFLVAATVFFGFHFFFGREKADGVTEDQDEQKTQYLQELEYYRTRTEQLETELTQIKEQQYASSLQYEARIAELEELLTVPEDKETAAPAPRAVYTYTVSNNEITITGYSGEGTTLSVPDTIDGLTVVAIGREAFKDSNLQEIVLPRTVKTIDWFAFYGCRELKTVSIPSSVTKIEYGVFDGCGQVTILCQKNSYAEKYARSYGMKVSELKTN